ncbi:MAG TPA: hypothetical protein VF384_12010 [Planctomycetota bacterium]
MVYDRADWHYADGFPEDLPPENGATHIGMYLSWALRRGFAGKLHVEHSAAAVAAVREGRTSGRTFLIEQCDEKFWEEDLDDAGNQFTGAYYESRYLADYSECFGRATASIYEVADTAANQRIVDAVLDRRLAEWKQAKANGKTPAGWARSKPWWRFW